MVNSGDFLHLLSRSKLLKNNKYQSGHKFCLFCMQFDKNKDIQYVQCW